MQKQNIEYTNDVEFLTFLNKEFDKTTLNASVEEIAEFAFGSLKEAIKAFEMRRSNEN